MVYKFTALSREEVKAMLGFTKPELKQTRFYQDVREEVLAEGRQEGELTLILRQLRRRLGTLPESLGHQIQTLSIPELESLGDALLDLEV